MSGTFRDIASNANPSFKMWRSLLKAHGIHRHGRAIVSGVRIVADILRDRPEIVEACLFDVREGDDVLSVPDGVLRYRLDAALFRELDVFGTSHPLLVVRVTAPESSVTAAAPPPMTLFVPFQDPSNVGAVIRSAVAFGVRDIVLPAEAASPYHPRSIRASGGCVFMASFTSAPSLTVMAPPTVPVYGLSGDGRPLGEFDFPQSCALLPGIEGPGLPRLPWITDTIAIPMAPGVESLNAAVATSIALYVWRTRRDSR